MRILITGSSNGIGKATALKFLNEGHEVYGLDILESDIKNKNYHHYLCDISKDLPKISEINVVINSAGTQNDENSIEINLVSTIKATEFYLDENYIKSVLFVASASARNGAEFPLYSASKGGIVTYMKNLALRLSKCGATVNSVSPGGVKTSFNDHIMNDKDKYKAVLDETLLKKRADPEEIAEWIYFITMINKSMTGEDILIDNGEMLKSNFIW